MFESAIERGANRLLAMDPAAAERIQAMAGRTVDIRLLGIPRSLFVRFAGDGGVEVDSLELAEADIAKADVVLSGSVFDFARAAASADDSVSPATLGVRIEGDAGLAQRFSALLRDMDIDFEDEAARYIGGAPAFHLGRVLSGMRDFARDTSQRIQDNAGEFLREESEQLVTPEDTEAFLDDVDTLRSDVDQMARRIAALDDGGAD